MCINNGSLQQGVVPYVDIDFFFFFSEITFAPKGMSLPC